MNETLHDYIFRTAEEGVAEYSFNRLGVIVYVGNYKKMVSWVELNSARINPLRMFVDDILRSAE